MGWYTGQNDPFKRKDRREEDQYLDTAESNSDRSVIFYDVHPDKPLPYEIGGIPKGLLKIAHDLAGKKMPLKEAVRILAEQAEKYYLNDCFKYLVSAHSYCKHIAVISVRGYSISCYPLIKYIYVKQ